MRRAFALTAAAIALSIVAAGCGGSDTAKDPTAAWASGFCSAVTSWTDELQTVTSQFTDTSNLSQDGLQSAANDVRDATENLVGDLKDLGAPETDSGQEVKTAVDGLSTTLENESASIDETAQEVTGITSLPSAITSISTSLAAMATSFSEAFQAIEKADVSGELQAALQDSPECADISS
jgi:methyl-accepting chemotaxis protein